MGKPATGNRRSVRCRESKTPAKESIEKIIENILLKICNIKIYPVIFASLKLIIKENL
jgi:hypothetical protein